MSKSKNVRVENELIINIGSLKLKRELFGKTKSYFTSQSYKAVNHTVQKILKTGSYQIRNLDNGTVAHIISDEKLSIELNSTATVITNIYPNEEQKNRQPNQMSQKGNNLTLVRSNNPQFGKSLDESFVESAIHTIYNKLLELDEYSREMNQSLSKTDKEISKIYHKLETTNFNASQGYFFAKSLQNLLRKRRFIKTELKKVQSVNNELKQIKELVQLTEEKVLSKQNQYEAYSNGWSFDLKDLVE